MDILPYRTVTLNGSFYKHIKQFFQSHNSTIKENSAFFHTFPLQSASTRLYSIFIHPFCEIRQEIKESSNIKSSKEIAPQGTSFIAAYCCGTCFNTSCKEPISPKLYMPTSPCLNTPPKAFRHFYFLIEDHSFIHCLYHVRFRMM